MTAWLQAAMIDHDNNATFFDTRSASTRRKFAVSMGAA
jgi:hypothetical protein